MPSNSESKLCGLRNEIPIVGPFVDEILERFIILGRLLSRRKFDGNSSVFALFLRSDEKFIADFNLPMLIKIVPWQYFLGPIAVGRLSY